MTSARTTPPAAKTWFITGTSTGFGRSMTEQLLARGDRVAATLRTPAALDDLKAQYGERLWVAPLDVTDTGAIRAVVDRAFAELGRIDVVVSNAGYGLLGAAEEVTDAQIRHQIDTNVIGSIQLIRAVLPHLRAQGGGRILQLSSMGGQITFPGLSLYHATKWAMEGFIDATAPEVAGFGIDFTLVEPGSAKTNFGSTSRVLAPTLAAYDDTPAADARRALLGGIFPSPGDPAKMARAMIDSVDVTPAPRRLTLGSDAYAHVHAGLSARLAALEAQKAIALSTDLDA
ncbi:SDR family oxidoreductase [Azorhizobium sp. AG788]|uniref:SDR family oxidoreductase n=1 Tax=Azorhizobium sp. AG788 TaxID=2183897 RepID=UPI0031396725